MRTGVFALINVFHLFGKLGTDIEKTSPELPAALTTCVLSFSF